MTEVIVKQDTVPAVEQTVGLIGQIERICMNPDMDVNKLEKILDAQDRILDRQSKQEFQIALSAMQADLPVIEKKGGIKAKLRSGDVMKSKFAKYEDINRAIMPVMKAHGFSLTFATDQDQDNVIVTGVLRHKGGHQETTRLSIPLDTSGSKNAVQAVGSSLSYGKRYVATALLNLTTAGEDDDGVSAVPAMDLKAHNFAMQANLDSIFAIKAFLSNDENKSAVRIWVEDISEDDRTALWVAPSNGGIFRTEERAALQKTSILRDES